MVKIGSYIVVRLIVEGLSWARTWALREEISGQNKGKIIPEAGAGKGQR